jgi:hypothetical protein
LREPIEHRRFVARIAGKDDGGMRPLAGSGRTSMKAFLSSVVVAIALAIGGYLLVGEFQQTVYEAFSTQGVRL